MQTKMSFKEYETEILYLLENPGKINRVSFFEQNYMQNVNNIYPFIEKNDDKEYLIEVCAYLLGKACETNIINVIRPDLKRIWISIDDVLEHIQMNLPIHLYDEVLEIMSGCENALESFNLDNINIKDLLLKVQFIGEMIVNKYKIYNITVDGYTNSQIAIPSELYTFANNILIKELINEGYSVDAVSESHTAAVSMVLSKGNIKMAVLESVVIEPDKPRFNESQKNKLRKYAEEKMCIPYILAIGLSSNKEDAKEKMVVPTNGQTVVKRSDFIRID